MPGNAAKVVACARRTKTLTTEVTLRQTALTTKYEKTKDDNARKTRQTTKRTKDRNAGQPETTWPTQMMQSQKTAHATRLEKDAVLTA